MRRKPIGARRGGCRRSRRSPILARGHSRSRRPEAQVKPIVSDELRDIPDKVFYKIGEVCQFTDTQPYVLRFWESEFPQLAPKKNRSGQRVYERKDLELVLRIKKLLNEEEFTIAGVRRHLEEQMGAGVEAPRRRAEGKSKPDRVPDRGDGVEAPPGLFLQEGEAGGRDRSAGDPSEAGAADGAPPSPEPPGAISRERRGDRDQADEASRRIAAAAADPIREGCARVAARLEAALKRLLTDETRPPNEG